MSEISGCQKCYMIFHFILAILALIACIFFNFRLIKLKPYNGEKYQNLLKNWKTSPISSISLNNNYINNYKASISEGGENYFLNMLNIEHMDDSYDFKYLISADISDKNFHACGIDSYGNSLFLPLDIECPINEIEISRYPFPSKNDFSYKTINLYDNIYLHYTNNNVFGYLINNFRINITKNERWENYIEFFNENKTQIFPIVLNSFVIKFIFENYEGYPEVYNHIEEKRNITIISFILNAKSIIKTTNIASFIIYILLFIFTILILIKETFYFLHIVNLILVTFVVRCLIIPIFDYNELIGDNEDIFEFNFKNVVSIDIIILICLFGYIFFYNFFFGLRSEKILIIF